MTDANTIAVVDGFSGDTLFSATPFGIPGTGTAADFTDDSIPELLAAAGPGGGPHVRLIDGATGLDIFSFYAFAEDFTGGVTVAAADVNGDGTLDIITAAGPGGGPHVRVWNGRDGRELMSFFAYDETFRGGVNVASADIDRDGFADIITGAGPGGGPHVRAFSGRTGAELLSYMAYDDYRGGVFVAAADFDRDGIAEIITGAGPGGGPHVRIWTGEQRIAETFVGDSANTQGIHVITRDTDGDGLADVLVTIRGAQAFTIASSEVLNRKLVAQPFNEIPFGVYVG